MKMRIWDIKMLLVLLVLLMGSKTHADWHGFASASAVWFSNPNADFVYNNLSSGAGRTHNVDFGLDTNLGLQWSGSPVSGMRLNGQGVLARDAANRFTPSLTLANMALDINSAFSLTLGRVQNPNFLYSDYRHVHYALPWLRPPREVYGITSIFNYDGAQANIELFGRGEYDLRLTAGLAQADTDYSRDGGETVDRLRATQMGYASLAWRASDWLVKLSYEQGSLFTDNAVINKAMATIAQTDILLAQQMALDGKDYRFMALGVRYDADDHLWLFEAAHRDLDAYFGRRSGVYTTYGHRLGVYMPYITLARTWTEVGNSQNLVAQRLYNSVKYALTAITLGVSYEWSSRMTVKGEMQWLKPDAGSEWAYEKYALGYNYASPSEDVLLSIGISTVF